ncbi:MAG: hypothetical protein JKY67_00135 [Pseudomonadales bacterium]|nr:hypothetical protein [Pseudomonadales bacterium]
MERDWLVELGRDLLESFGDLTLFLGVNSILELDDELLALSVEDIKLLPVEVAEIFPLLFDGEIACAGSEQA